MSHEGPAGHFPPTTHKPPVSEEQRRFSRAHNPEAIARAKGAGTGGKSNLAGQIIPIYGFGILLYILYILFKVRLRHTRFRLRDGHTFNYSPDETPSECPPKNNVAQTAMFYFNNISVDKLIFLNCTNPSTEHLQNTILHKTV